MSRIVAGVDGSPGAAAALRWALDEARLRGATLHVVHAWRLPLYAAAPEAAFAGVTPASERLDAEVEAVLAEQASGVVDDAVASLERESGGDLGVELRVEAVRGPAAGVLLERAAGADALVVGSRGHGGFAGLLLGSVSQQCVQHAPCPVVVVPAPAHGEK
ncbi:MAG TPA: universal stress protein [Gaiellaceae bacterium]|nr:universal stress protein [Gaiellaceae bacterium]